MQFEWDEKQPIYFQIRDHIVGLMLDGALADGDALPSIRELAGDSRVNPLTVHKSYQLLVDEGLVESRRGRGMFVVDGASLRLLEYERRRFIEQDWPRVVATAQRLGIDITALMAPARKAGNGGGK